MLKESTSQLTAATDEILHAVERFAHVLPAQASIKDFVHHNTLHGFEHLKFPDAMKASHELTGAYGYWPQLRFRQSYREERLTDDGIKSALLKNKSLNANDIIIENKKVIRRHDVYRTAALFSLKKISRCQLIWQTEEAHALVTFQDDIPEDVRVACLGATKESDYIQALWKACINVLNLDVKFVHPEGMTNLAPEQAEKIFSKIISSENGSAIANDVLPKTQETQQEAWQQLEALVQDKTGDFNLHTVIKQLTDFNVTADIEAKSSSKINPLIQKKSWQQLNKSIDKIGHSYTLRGFLKALTGEDVQTEIVPYLLPYISNWLDEGFARWHANSVMNKSFYQSWKASAKVDSNRFFNDIPDWQEHLNSLPNSALDTIVTELGRMGIPEDKWGAYITRLALDLPGWSGMFYWRHKKPEYNSNTEMQVDIFDYLAVRLVLEHLHIRKLCRRLWLIEGDLDTIRGYLHQQDAEHLVRYGLFNEHLPEYVKGSAQRLIALTAQRESLNTHKEEWQQLAQIIWTWQQSDDVAKVRTTTRGNDQLAEKNAWVLFRLAQHLGLNARDISQLNATQINTLFDCIAQMDKQTAGFILLQAYENHYRDQVFATVAKNHGRGTWANRDQRPQAQLIFCMDDREEGLRRHLEHQNPAIETFGAAAFFGIVMNWKGLYEKESFPLCPVVATPQHEIEEVADAQHVEAVEKHKRRAAVTVQLKNFIHQDSHRSVLKTAFLTALYMPIAFLTLAVKIFSPLTWSERILSLQKSLNKKPVTRIDTTFSKDKSSSFRHLKHGFTIDEQTNIVEAFLQNNGLLSGFSNFVVLIGHYSNNQNNPHASAYGCGACSGKFSGPNGRAFAAMANHPEVRKQLVKRTISIPDDCWFVGAEHDTCNEKISWEDIDLIPEPLQKPFKKLQNEVALACQQSAHERCRKLASAPKNPTLKSAKKHIAGRAVDISQARPELGHATIATGFVGRRHLSQGMFMDRRCFLISYDASVDPEGKFLERILLSAGPVGAGINLEYYFSAVNNERYGCGSKIVHNLSGLFGVMEGASGDLRTGLPLQMIEIHEPMRLQLMVEAKIETLTQIYNNQPSIQELVGNGWVLLSAKDPDSDQIHTFNPEKGWEIWSNEANNKKGDNTAIEVSTIKQSEDWYNGNYDHLPAALIETVKVHA